MPTAVTRQYNPTSGKLIGNISEVAFGHVPLGRVSGVKAIDLSVEGVDAISNVRIQVTASDIVPVNDSPTDIGADGSAGNGNFGCEHSSDFLPRSTLTRYFAGIEDPVTVGTRASKLSQHVYLNVKMNATGVGDGSVTYQWLFDYS
jgi:hypothetical protein